MTLAGPVSPRTLNAACLRVKVEVSAAACGWQSTKKSLVNRPTDHG